MGNKKRPRNYTIYGCVEGHRELALLGYLQEIYHRPEDRIKFTIENAKGGGADSIVLKALSNAHVYDKSFAWLDEDFEPDDSPLSEDVRSRLAANWHVATLASPLGGLQHQFNSKHHKPVLIVSQPVCCESLILQIMGESLPYPVYDPLQRSAQIKHLKTCVNQLMGNNKMLIEEQIEYYRQHLSIAIVQQRRATIPLLDLLITMITK